MAKLLVIGGSGFFGKSILSAFKRGLLKPWGIDMVSIVARNATLLKSHHPELITSGIELQNLDICSTTAVPDADYIIHAAASSNAANYLSQSLVEKANIQAATYNFCQLISDKKPHSKIVFTSSGAVYGQQNPDLEYLTESVSLLPIESLAIHKQDYALAKRDAELAIQNLGRKGYSVSIARCFAFVGPYLPRDQHFAIGNFLQDGLSERPIKVNANKLVYRSYMYADDLVEWLMTIAAAGNTQCPIFNVGSREAFEVRELALVISRIFGVEVIAPEISTTEIDRYIPSVDSAFNTLGLTNKYDLEGAIKETLKQIRGA